jgi:hypothetical protein
MIKTYNEWLSERGIDELGSDDFGMETTADMSLVGEQTAMMMQRFVGLLHGLSPQQKSSVIEQAIKDLRRLV